MAIEWKNEDPRYTIGKRGQIVIYDGRDAWAGDVETKEGWAIWTTHEFDRYRFISADDEWPTHWWWTYAPSTF